MLFVEYSSEQQTISCSEHWTVYHASDIQTALTQLSLPEHQSITVDASQLSQLDSAGAWLISSLCEQLKSANNKVTLTHFSDQQQSLLQLLDANAEAITSKLPEKEKHGFFYRFGEEMANKLTEGVSGFSFVGEWFMNTLTVIIGPRRIQWNALINSIEHTGYRALPIIALLSFLVGVVLTYQMGLQLQEYGANILIVWLTGLAIFREFGPLMTAIIVAARSSTAFTAQIGAMKINEEIDALRSMGLLPMDRIVIPRVLALIIILPLLTAWSDFFGMLGSMVMSKAMLGIPYEIFIERVQSEMKLIDLTAGLVQTPIFALIIGIVGCYRGFRVGLSAKSVGIETTKSVVQAIFLIIIADASFSVLFSMFKI